MSHKIKNIRSFDMVVKNFAINNNRKNSIKQNDLKLKSLIVTFKKISNVEKTRKNKKKNLISNLLEFIILKSKFN